MVRGFRTAMYQYLFVHTKIVEGPTSLAEGRKTRGYYFSSLPSFQLSTLTNCLGLTMERILFTDSPSERPSKSMKANEHLWHVPITISIELCYYRLCVWWWYVVWYACGSLPDGQFNFLWHTASWNDHRFCNGHKEDSKRTTAMKWQTRILDLVEIQQNLSMGWMIGWNILNIHWWGGELKSLWKCLGRSFLP